MNFIFLVLTMDVNFSKCKIRNLGGTCFKNSLDSNQNLNSARVNPSENVKGPYN